MKDLNLVQNSAEEVTTGGIYGEAFSVVPINDEVLFEEEKQRLQPITIAFFKEVKVSHLSLENQSRLLIKAIKVLKDNGNRVRIYYTQELKITKDKASLLAKRGRLFQWADIQDNPKEEIEYINSLSDSNIKFITRNSFKNKLESLLREKPNPSDIKRLYSEERTPLKKTKTKKRPSKVIQESLKSIVHITCQEVLEHTTALEERLDIIQEASNV